jgi:hypothetical protein
VTAQIGIVLVYLINVLAALLLFFGPAYVWSRHFMTKKMQVKHIIWVFFGSIAVFLMLPVLRLGRVKVQGVLGADITTQQIPTLGNVWPVLLIGLLVCAIFYLLVRRNRERSLTVALLVVFLYFGIYLYHFFASLAMYYSSSVGMLAQHGRYFIALHMMLFFVVTILFYVCGYLMFLYKACVIPSKTFK